MTFDRAEYAQHIAEKQKQQINGQRTNLEAIRQAAVKADLLTGDTNWDTFLSYLQAASEALSTELNARRNELNAPDMVDQNDIMRLKVRIYGLEMQIGTIQGIIELPKDIRERGEDASNLLSRLDG